MSKALTVVPDVVRSAPVEDLTRPQRLQFHLVRTAEAGRHVVKVVNQAAQGHELILAQLAPGKTVQDMVHFIEGLEKGTPTGPPPGMPYSGIGFMAPGQVNYLTLDLQPGEYGEICVVPDAKDGKPHVMHGMVAQISVK
jgi:hypothetical protein